MESQGKKYTSENSQIHKNKVHGILLHSYSVYLILFLIGVYLDIFFKVKVFVNNNYMVSLGTAILILATFLILWAQMTSRNLKKDVINKDTFCQGPYCYTRSPTHWGLFFLILGFGIIANAFFVILSAFVSFVITKLFFLERQENILAEKYGAPYLEYKKVVKF
jgi:protein-S-isoprenylcysteine O-methyltransferase Ste14